MRAHACHDCIFELAFSTFTELFRCRYRLAFVIFGYRREEREACFLIMIIVAEEGAPVPGGPPSAGNRTKKVLPCKLPDPLS
ncbi:hypothetical protein C9410_14320 [Rhizobium sp. SEMIA 439]|nr:hypothetical protein F7R04_06335 [Agrobacterium tumefaciens]TGE79291.1 hypothetical protein C9410_14320 [Rhizobium sp. SEMIA 439]